MTTSLLIISFHPSSLQRAVNSFTNTATSTAPYATNIFLISDRNTSVRHVMHTINWLIQRDREGLFSDWPPPPPPQPLKTSQETWRIGFVTKLITEVTASITAAGRSKSCVLNVQKMWSWVWIPFQYASLGCLSAHLCIVLSSLGGCLALGWSPVQGTRTNYLNGFMISDVFRNLSRPQRVIRKS
jgi:hypothetical protein